VAGKKPPSATGVGLSGRPIEVPLRWNIPEDVLTRYATNMTIQEGADEEWIVSFFDSYPPIMLGSAEEQRKQATALTHVDARCFARIVMNEKRLRDLLRLLQIQVGRLDAAQREAKPK
jgi:hypothetical protein